MVQNKINNFIQYANPQRKDECYEKIAEETFTKIKHSRSYDDHERKIKLQHKLIIKRLIFK